MTLFDAAIRPSRRFDAGFEASRLEPRALEHAAVRHAVLARIARVGANDAESVIQRVACEYLGLVEALPSLVWSLAEKLGDESQRSLWHQRLAGLQGELHDDDLAALRAHGLSPHAVQGVAREALFLRFTRAMGVADDTLVPAGGAAATWQQQMQQLIAEATPAAAVGALVLGVELIEPATHRQWLRGLLGLGTLRRDDFVFFELANALDARHHFAARQVVADHAATPAGLVDVRAGMMTALELRAEFWDRVLRTLAAATRAG
jgi:hypothetical protein